MTEEPHAVVRLLLERIASNPEEFKRGTARWVSVTNKVEDWGSEADKQTINDALREIRLTEAHEEMMEELLNGEDRRRKESEENQQTYQALSQQQVQTTPFRFPLGGIL
jgi:DNA polymerase III delta prime subunit